MKFVTVLCVTILFTLTTGFSFEERNHARRWLFGSDKDNDKGTDVESPSFNQGFSKWLGGLLSGDSKNEKQSDSFSKLALLKQLLSSSSSSSDKSSKLDKLFQLLTSAAKDKSNQDSSSSSKMNLLLSFMNKQDSSSSSSSSSNNYSLAWKLLNLAQGSGGLSSLSITDMKSLAKFFG